MNLDMSKFRKIKEDRHTATFKHTKDGHEMTVAKKALSSRMNNQLAKLPMHYLEGGEVESLLNPKQKDPIASMPPAQVQPQQPTIIINNGPQGGMDPQPMGGQMPMMPQPQMAQAPQPIPAMAAPAPELSPPVTSRGASGSWSPEEPQVKNAGPVPADDPYGTNAYLQNYEAGLGAQQEGLIRGADAESALGRQQAGILNENARTQASTLADYQEQNKRIQSEFNSAMDDARNGHMDENHFMNSRTSGQKASIGIGLILGGIGGGLRKGPNEALQMLNQMIDRDVIVQRAEMDRKQNLLAANFKQFGNLRDAMEMTQAMQMGFLKTRLESAAAQSQDPIVKARALQAAGALDVQAAPILSQIAMRRTLLAGQNAQGQRGPSDPAMAIRMIVPENQQKDAFKELDEAQKLVKLRDNALSAFDFVDKENTVMNRVTSPLQTSRRVNAQLNPVMSELSKELSGKFTEFEFDKVREMFPIVGDDAQTVQSKRTKFNNILNQSMNFNLLNSYGIKPESIGRYNSSSEKKIQLGAPVLTGN